MGLLDKLNQLALEQNYKRMFLLEGDEFKEAALNMLGNVPNATSSNAHNKEMEMFLYKLFGKASIENVTFGGGQSADLFSEFIKRGYPLAQELNFGTQNTAFGKIVMSQTC